MSAHEDGIKAAILAAEHVDWVAGLFGSDIGSGQELFCHQLSAYLEASGQVLVPRQPSIEMSLAGGAVTVTHWENDRDYQDPIEAYAAEIVWEKMLGAYPQPFSQDKT